MNVSNLLNYNSVPLQIILGTVQNNMRYSTTLCTVYLLTLHTVLFFFVNAEYILSGK